MLDLKLNIVVFRLTFLTRLYPTISEYNYCVSLSCLMFIIILQVSNNIRLGNKLHIASFIYDP